MKPKTAIQKKVVEMSINLPKINESQKQYAIDNIFGKSAVISRNKLFCLECGHTWKDEQVVKIVKCPECENLLKIRENGAHLTEVGYMGIVETYQGYQVVRIVSCTKFMTKKEKPTYSLSDVLQHWIDEKGNFQVISKATQMMSRYYDQWIFSSELEPRTPSQSQIMRENINPYKIYPKVKVLPIIKRNGFKTSFHDLAPQGLLKSVLTDPITEYLLKTKQNDILKHLVSRNLSYKVKEYLPSIKICYKNGYKIKDFSIWSDHMDLLKKFDKDLRSPKYICPNDLISTHNKLVSKNKAIDKRKKLQKLKKEIEDSQITYSKEKRKFFELEFKEGDVTIKVISKVKDFLEEGVELGHCLFNNSYYKTKESLIFSARIGTERMETIEVSLIDFKIQQARGLGNKPSKHHKKILELMKSNLHQVQKASQNKILETAA